MIRHIIIAAFRNMAANRLISAIAILGLAAGIAAALVMGLVVRNQMTFDSFIPGHERTYRLFYRDATDLACRRRAGTAWAITDECLPNNDSVPVLKQSIPALENIARLQMAGPVKFQQGDVTAWDSFFWTDPDFFAVMPLPVLHGTLKDALARPDTLVLTRAMARKYFGRDDVVGRTLMVAGYPMAVRAVLRDLPQNANSLDNGIFASMLGAPARVSRNIEDVRSTRPGLQSLQPFSNLYLRIKPGASITQAEVTDAYWSMPRLKGVEQRLRAYNPTFNRDVALLRLDRVNLWEPLNPGITLRLGIAASAGALVLLIAAINFVNLMVAGSIRREKEVGLRKACGGGRGALMLQFLGESMVVVGIAAAIGAALTEWLLPTVNAFLRTGAVLDWSDPLLLVALLGCIAMLALTIGAWPSFVLSGFRPVFALRGWAARTSHAGAIRGTLVTLQFAILIILAIAASVVWLQRDFAAREAMRVNGDQMLLLRTGALTGSRMKISGLTQAQACPPVFLDRMRRLPGVRGAACSSGSIIAGGKLIWIGKSGHNGGMNFHPADPRIFALYGIRPIAGVLPQITGSDADIRAVGAVINMAAVRKLGFASPQAALGKSWVLAAQTQADFIKLYSDDFGRDATIIAAVVPDFSFAPVTEPVGATLYTPWSTFDKGWDDSGLGLIHIKLAGRDIPETAAAIDRIWAGSDTGARLDRFFLDDYMQQLYQDMTRDAEFFAGCTLLAVILACLGLVGIAISTAERRTKEIGVRKAMGADNRQIVALLLWEFAQPVLGANVIAWPAAWWLMRRWLSGFAYHVDLHWWVFAAASLAALLIALLTVAGQAFLTARQKPVLALRYE
jgi:putative ABC transport system permease protein